ncbi:hypothetical protein Adi01nite_33740 [Amorphoplanes digitatis]|nr:hypothetical protein Adi01nite_33740 [Actinoplanes digitatis]
MVGEASGRERAALTGAAYSVAWPVVYERVTRSVELRRGHSRCAASVRSLADECLDRFHDDVEAVVGDLLCNARQPVVSVEAWLTSRIKAATVDGHRRRRGARGALQRPRLPQWLAAELGHDSWLTSLALKVLDWVGVPQTAGADTWPLDSWAQSRRSTTGDWQHGDTAVVAREVDVVLRAMRTRPKWFECYVERPLGMKAPPVAGAPADDVGELRPLRAADPGEVVDARLRELAAAAVEAIGRGLADGGDPARVVSEVLNAVFGRVTPADLNVAPHVTADPTSRISELLADRKILDRIVADVVTIVRGPEASNPPQAPAEAAAGTEPTAAVAEMETRDDPPSWGSPETPRRGRPRLYSDDTLGLIVDARLNGRTLRNISEMLNAAGIPTPTGRGLWYPSHVSRLLLTRDAQALIASRRQEDQWGLTS